MREFDVLFVLHPTISLHDTLQTILDHSSILYDQSINRFITFLSVKTLKKGGANAMTLVCR